MRLENFGRLTAVFGILVALILTLSTWHSREGSQSLSEDRQRWQQVNEKLRTFATNQDYSLIPNGENQQQQPSHVPQQPSNTAFAGLSNMPEMDERMQAMGVLEKAMGLGNPVLAAALPANLQRLITQTVSEAENPQIQAWANKAASRHFRIRQERSGTIDSTEYQNEQPLLANQASVYHHSLHEYATRNRDIVKGVALTASPNAYPADNQRHNAQLDLVQPDPELDQELYRKDLGVVLLLAYIAIMFGILSLIVYIIRSSCFTKKQEDQNADEDATAEEKTGNKGSGLPDTGLSDGKEQKDGQEETDILGAGQRWMRKYYAQLPNPVQTCSLRS
jgi:hypothetical protein